jgi:hypothetical protein
MKEIIAVIEEESERLQTHPFFELRTRAWAKEDFGALLRGIACFVFTFQDLVFLNEMRIEDPDLREFAGRRRREDAGHSLWFLDDLRDLGVLPSLNWLFGPEHLPTRETSYELLSEVFRAETDGVRVAIPMALEASGTVFFRNMYELVCRAGLETRFFSRTHWEVETKHEALTEDEEKLLASIQWADAELDEARSVVRRMFKAKARMLTSLRETYL